MGFSRGVAVLWYSFGWKWRYLIIPMTERGKVNGIENIRKWTIIHASSRRVHAVDIVFIESRAQRLVLRLSFVSCLSFSMANWLHFCTGAWFAAYSSYCWPKTREKRKLMIRGYDWWKQTWLADTSSRHGTTLHKYLLCNNNILL